MKYMSMVGNWDLVDIVLFIFIAILGVILGTISSVIFHVMHPDVVAHDRAVAELRSEERRLIYAEDPERVRILRNHFYYFKQFMDTANSRETIELRATPTRVRPGETVQLEAIPSPGTSALGSWVLAIQDRWNYVSLGRQWFGNNYQRRISMQWAGTHTFRVITAAGHHSNSVSILVAPDCSQLSRIYLADGCGSQREREMISIPEGNTIQLTLFGPGLGEGRSNLSMLKFGARLTVENESIAKVMHDHDGILLKGLTQGRTTLRARYGSLEAETPVEVRPSFSRRSGGPLEPPLPSGPLPVKPLDGFVGHVGERIHLEVASFDISMGHTFRESSWSVSWIDPETGERSRVMASLRDGNSERAEWIPRRAGTYEWRMTFGFHYDTDRRRIHGSISSPPQRIVIVE